MTSAFLLNCRLIQTKDFTSQMCYLWFENSCNVTMCSRGESSSSWTDCEWTCCF